MCESIELRLVFFFFNDTATTEIYTLSLHDALPIFCGLAVVGQGAGDGPLAGRQAGGDRKSTRLNSSHSQISYAVFCLKKKNAICIALYHQVHALVHRCLCTKSRQQQRDICEDVDEL